MANPLNPKGVHAQSVQTRKLVTNAVLIALHVILCQVATINIGNSLSITLSGITESIAGLLFGPISGGLVGLLGSFLNQLIRYGLSVTTVLWILPAGMKGLLCGWFAKSNRYEMNPLKIYWVLIVTSVVVTSMNTTIMIVDATIFGYNTQATVLAQMGIRYLNGALTSLAYMLIAVPLLKNLQKLPGIRDMQE